MVSQHLAHRADRDHRRHTLREQGQLCHPALVWLNFESRFTDMDSQLTDLYRAEDLVKYEKCLIRPFGQIDWKLIISDRKRRSDRPDVGPQEDDPQ